MARILLAWELGAGYGHLTMLRRIADAARSRGHDVVYAVRSLDAAADVLGVAAPLIQAPLVGANHTLAGTRLPLGSLPDILYSTGFSHASTLLPAVRGWEMLLDMLRPDVIVADYAPVLTLTAWSFFPVLAVGTGFTLPPRHLVELPPLSPQAGPGIPAARILEVAEEIQALRQAPALGSLGALVGGDRAFAFGLGLFDPYRDLRLEPLYAPLEPLLPSLPSPTDPRSVFAYLGGDFPPTMPALVALAEMARDRNIRVGAYVRRGSQRLGSTLAALGVTVYNHPPPLADALAEHAVVVHHGGIGTASAALATGRPQVLLSQHLEHGLNGDALARLGCGVTVAGGGDPSLLARAVATVIDDPAAAARASAGAAAVSRGQPDGLAPMLDAIDGLAGSGGAA